MRAFELIRHDGATQVVAIGEEQSNGTVCLDWVGGASGMRWRNIADLMSEHCSDGRTVLRWHTPFTGDPN